MPTWDDVVREISATMPNPNSSPNYDVVRRRYLAEITKHTGRPVVLYAADFIDTSPAKRGIRPSIDVSDMEGFLEATENLKGPSLDVILHSPGGSAEAAESIVEFLRSRFHDIRFIIPAVAKSAATMLAMSGNILLMDHISELGPIDPQWQIPRGDGSVITAPAQAVVDQFEVAKKQIASDPSSMAAWIPILKEYAPAFLVQSQNALNLAEALVTRWLAQYMFAGNPDSETKAKNVASYLNSHNNFLSHGRRIGMDALLSQEVKVEDLRSDPVFHRLVRRLYVAVSETFEGTGAYKIFENNLGECLVRLVLNIPISLSPQQPQPKPPGTPPEQQLNRQQRRAKEREKRN